MKKILTASFLASSLLVSGCSLWGSGDGEVARVDELRDQESKQKVVSLVSDEKLDKLADAQASGSKENCKKFTEDYLQKQCELTIEFNKNGGVPKF